MKHLAVLCVLFACVALSAAYVNLDLIHKVNSNPASTWKAGVNDFFRMKSPEQVRRYFNSGSRGPKDPAKIKPWKEQDIKVPSSFDSATNWPNCTSMTQIRNQAECGSCWAFGSVEAFTDRYCVATKQQQNPILSTQYMVTCDNSDDGCEGGDPMNAWGFIEESGLPLESCQAYNIPTCPPAQQPCTNFQPTPPCLNTCYSNSSESISDRYYTQEPYYVSGGVGQMEQEVYQNGPIEVCFTVYEDFLNYKSGVYYYQSGEALGGHCVKLLGWGTLNGVDYWKCANSWTNYWGDKGYFLIRRGTDECGIEDDVVAGIPIVK